jgi:DNA topoisomerase-3
VKTALGVCPLCGKDVYSTEKSAGSYYCSGYKGDPPCKFNLFKSQSGAVFTKEMVQALLKGEVLNDVSCFSKEGKEYKSGFRLDSEGNLVKIVYGS